MNSCQLDKDSIINFLINSCFIILILLSPLIYGSITILPLSLLEGISFFVLFIFLLKIFLFEDTIFLIKTPALFFIFLFIFLIFFQLLPLCLDFIAFFSPATVSLYKNFMVQPLLNLFTLSIYQESTINIFLQFLSYLAVFFVILNYLDTQKKERRLILLIIYTGFIYSLYGIIRILIVPRGVFSTFTNENHFAAYIEMIIPLTITYSLIEISRPKRIVFIFIAVVQILALFFSLSRAGIICFSLSFFLLFFLIQLKRKIKKSFGGIIILLLSLSLFLGIIGIQSIIKELSSLSNPIAAYADRFGIVKDSLKIIKDFPIFGTGLGTFGEIFQKYKTSAVQVSYIFAHNEPLQLLAETGIFGFLFIFLFLFFYLGNIFSLWLKRRDRYVIYITLGTLISLVSVILHSIFDFVFHVPANTLLFFILLALSFRIVYIKESQSLLPIPQFNINLPQISRIFLLIIFCLAFLWVESLILKRYRAERIFEGVKERKITETDIDAIFQYKKLIRCLNNAIVLNQKNSAYFSKEADLFAELATHEDLKNEGLQKWADSSSTEELLADAEKFYKMAINLNPTRSDYHLKLGWLYSIQGNSDLMQQQFGQALLLDPDNSKIKSYIEKYKVLP